VEAGIQVISVELAVCSNSWHVKCLFSVLEVFPLWDVISLSCL